MDKLVSTCKKSIAHAKTQLEVWGHVTEEIKAAMEAMATDDRDFEGKNELIEFIEEAEIQEQINKIKKQQEDEVRTTMKRRPGEEEANHHKGQEEKKAGHLTGQNQG